MALYGALAKDRNLSDLLDKAAARANLDLSAQFSGDHFYVDSGNSLAEDTIRAGSRNTPFLTMDFAVGQMAADNGDVMWVLPGHVETISAAGELVFDVKGITVIGLGLGKSMPTVKMDTATTTDIDIDADNVTIEGINFEAGFADVAICLDVNKTDFTMRYCRFTEAASNKNFKICVQDAAAGASDRMTLEYNYALQPDAANTHFVNFAGTGAAHSVRYNTLLGDWGTMAIGGAGIVTFAVVTDNVIYNAASTSDGCINFASTATGICMRNLCGGAAAQANGVTATAFAIAENYYGVLSEDLSAILDPVIT